MLRLCRTVFCLGLISGMMPVLWADPEDKPCPSMTCKIEVNECEWDTFFEAEEDMGISSPVGRPAELLAWLPAVQTPEPVPPVPVVRREGRVPRDRDENGDDRRGGPPEGRRDGFGNNSQPQVSEEKLMEFLEKHEPKLAERLKGLKESEPWQYRRQMGALGRLYGAVISQMERDPEMGELELKRIRLQLKIKDRQRDYRRADNDDEKKKAKGELKKYVAELFDVILDQENHRYERFAEHLKDFHSSGS